MPILLLHRDYALVPHQTLWHEYEKLEASFDNFAMKNIKTVDDIFLCLGSCSRKRRKRKGLAMTAKSNVAEKIKHCR
ncbi:DUF444 family protein [Vibrio lentus]|nr:DUF444 family protein [Vibrio lentus]